jgi:hypothetical protein
MLRLLLTIQLAIALAAPALAQHEHHYDEEVPDPILIQEPPDGITRDMLEVFRGHPLLSHLSEFDLEKVAIGKIDSKVGNLLTIKFEQPSSVEIDGETVDRIVVQNPPHWDFNPGDTVVMGFKDGGWNFVGDGHCRLKWVLNVQPKAPITFEETPVKTPKIAEELPPAPPIPALW